MSMISTHKQFQKNQPLKPYTQVISSEFKRKSARSLCDAQSMCQLIDYSFLFEVDLQTLIQQECIRSKAHHPLHDRNQNTYNLILE